MTAIDDEALAEAYNRALRLEKSGNFDAAAIAYREVLALDPDDHGGAAVRLASMQRGDTPPKAPDAYVTTLFDQHADDFDDILVEQLGYCVPLMVQQRVQALGLGPFSRLLDLGCGTGLTGVAMNDIADDITGVDLSEKMVEAADEREVYDTLYVDEAVAFLEDIGDAPWDMIAATDVLPYMGHLEAFFAGAARCTTPGALLAFSSETQPDEIMAGRDFMVGPHQRFAHAESYVRRLLDAAGFDCIEAGGITVRHEQGQPVPGHLYLAKKRSK